MSYTSLLVNICTVERDTPGAATDYGTPSENWAAHLTDEPCRIQAISGVEIVVGAKVVIANYKLFIGDVDITEQDRVVIGAVTYQVLLVSDRQDSSGVHHIECLMRTVR